MTLFGIGVDDVKLVLEKERILKLQISFYLQVPFEQVLQQLDETRKRLKKTKQLIF